MPHILQQESPRGWESGQPYHKGVNELCVSLWPWLLLLSLLIPSCTHSSAGRKHCRKKKPLSPCSRTPQKRIYNQEEQTIVTFRMEPAGHHIQGKTAQGFLGYPEQDTSFLLHQARHPLMLFIPQVVAQSPDTHFHCSCCLRDFLASKTLLHNSFNNFY